MIDKKNLKENEQSCVSNKSNKESHIIPTEIIYRCKRRKRKPIRNDSGTIEIHIIAN